MEQSVCFVLIPFNVVLTFTHSSGKSVDLTPPDLICCTRSVTNPGHFPLLQINVFPLCITSITRSILSGGNEACGYKQQKKLLLLYSG